MSNSQETHTYLIRFPDGELVYKPLEGLVFDVRKKRSYSLVEKREFSVLNKLRTNSKILSSDFMPVCLTVYSSHQCNLRCSYCYIPQKESYPNQFVDPRAIEQGTQIVAANCKKRNEPFVVGFHGGNEPLLNPKKLEESLTVCEKAAIKNDVEFLPFCTTNGYISEETAQWAAKRFYGITLSWDGMPYIHDKFRQDFAKNGTSEKVEKTAKIFSENISGRFLVRCTITSSSVSHLTEIVNYFYEAGIEAVEFYPVFMDKQDSFPNELLPEPSTFVYNFLKARKYGLSKGMKILFSGSRLKDFHNRYCMLLQDNLTITPDGYLTNCYHCAQNFEGKDSLFFYGKYNKANQKLFIDHEKVEKIFEKYNPDLEECKSCFNQFHCSHGCPDLCPFTDEFDIFDKPDCIKEKWIGYATILERAGYKRDFKSEADFFEYYKNITNQRLN